MAEIVDCQVTQEEGVCAGGKSTTSIPSALAPGGSTEVSKFKGTCTLPSPLLYDVPHVSEMTDSRIDPLLSLKS